MKKMILCIALLLIYIFLPAELKAEGITYDEIKFFETGDEYPDKDDRYYQSEFQQSATRYIACELNIYNNLYDDHDKTYKLEYKYYSPDGSLFGEISDNLEIKSEWYTAWYVNSWGWSETGNWEGGEYSVKIYINDQFFGQGNFKIFNDESMLFYTSTDFFAGGYNAPAPEYRKYKTTFLNNETCYIWTEIRFDNNCYLLEDQLVKFKLAFYYPDSSFMGNSEFEYFIPSDWESGSVWNGYGWDEPGNWTTGTYRVVIFFGTEEVGQSNFNIY
ncbi:MAG: hypothetical protein JXB60_03560 [Candidatus Cloacimonetes bacterium]|nr:hypothetical protein [Candidatus Cloacimonadota bacterium]